MVDVEKALPSVNLEVTQLGQLIRAKRNRLNGDLGIPNLLTHSFTFLFDPLFNVALGPGDELCMAHSFALIGRFLFFKKV